MYRLNLFLSVLEVCAPVFIVAGIGFFWKKFGYEYRIEFVTQLVMSLTIPCLIFNALIQTQIDYEILKTLLYATLTVLAMIVVASFLIGVNKDIGSLAVNNFSAPGLLISSSRYSVPSVAEYLNNKIRLNGEKKLVEAIELTSLMNSSMLSGVVHCAWGISKEKGASKDIKFENSANSLTKITNALEVNNIKLGIEPLNRYETDFINTVDEGLHLCSLINHSNVGLLLDVYHMNIEEKNICSSIKRAKNKLFHFHVAENDRGIPGSGTLDFDSIFETLKEINYSGYVTLEMFIQANKQTSKDLFTWRDIEVDPYKAIKDSHLFLSKYY